MVSNYSEVGGKSNSLNPKYDVNFRPQSPIVVRH